jgi:hypothetical protein
LFALAQFGLGCGHSTFFDSTIDGAGETAGSGAAGAGLETGTSDAAAVSTTAALEISDLFGASFCIKPFCLKPCCPPERAEIPH